MPAKLSPDSKMDIPPLKFLPVETRQEIFQNLPVESLLNCALVDRQLCHEIIPLLWKDPLLDVRISRNRRVVETYVRCLSNSKRQYLRKVGIRKAPVSTNPTFDYPTF